MKKSVLLFFLFINSIKLVNSQEYEFDLVYPKTLVRLHILIPGILIEQNIKENFTVIFDAGTGFTFQKTEINGVSKSEFYLNPFLRFEPRIYTKLDERRSLGKRTDNYSSQYIGFQAKVGLPTKKLETWTSLGVLWGFQRTLWKKGYWNIGLGAGIISYSDMTVLGPIGDFGIGFILN